MPAGMQLDSLGRRTLRPDGKTIIGIDGLPCCCLTANCLRFGYCTMCDDETPPKPTPTSYGVTIAGITLLTCSGYGGVGGRSLQRTAGSTLPSPLCALETGLGCRWHVNSTGPTYKRHLNTTCSSPAPGDNNALTVYVWRSAVNTINCEIIVGGSPGVGYRYGVAFRGISTTAGCSETGDIVLSNVLTAPGTTTVEGPLGGGADDGIIMGTGGTVTLRGCCEEEEI